MDLPDSDPETSTFVSLGERSGDNDEDAPADSTSPAPDGYLCGTVVSVEPPAPSSGNPYFVCVVNLDSGDMVTLRRRFLTAPFRVPHVSEGHHIRFAGKQKRNGYINPFVIVNETTGVRWRQLVGPPILILITALVVGLVAVGVYLLIFDDDGGGDEGRPASVAIPDVIGSDLMEARVDMSEAGLTNVREIAEDSDSEIFTVTRVEPEEGTIVERGALVRLYFAFPDMPDMPDSPD